MEPAEKATIELGQMIKKRRKEKQLSQTQLALLAGVSLNLISQIEAGKPRVQLIKILHVMNILGLQLKIGIGRDLLVPEKSLLSTEGGN